MKGYLVFAAMLFTMATLAQNKIENVILVTTDGLRWQEVFKGLDPEFTRGPWVDAEDSLLIVQEYWDRDPIKTREKLMPFMWSYIAKHGQIYGNRQYGNFVNVMNPYWYSYPGYNEMITGYGDPAINSNDIGMNPNVSVFEYLVKQPAFKNKAAAFGAWEAFNRILNEDRSGIPVVTGYQPIKARKLSAREQFLNELKEDTRTRGKDIYALHGALECLRNRKPRLLQVSFDDTDHYSHASQYYNYINAARLFDQYLEKIWNYVQSDPHYRNKTAIIVTTDHGRGDAVKKEWSDHGGHIKGADQVWIAVLAPGIPPRGEVKEPMQLHLAQVAQTIAKFLGQTYTGSHPIAPAIKEIWEK
ncbi:MAG TPA: alkaline phosphatase family protein [Flavihumibacter sp.]